MFRKLLDEWLISIDRMKYLRDIIGQPEVALYEFADWLDLRAAQNGTDAAPEVGACTF